MNRLDMVFAELRKKGEGALVTLAPSEPPPFAHSLEIADMFAAAGADVVEIAIPSTFPWMEGETMQRHQLEAKVAEVRTTDSFSLATKVREGHPDLPLVAINFTCVLFSHGVERYINDCAQAGFDAVDVPDYPLGRSGDDQGFVSGLLEHNVYSVNPISDTLAMAGEGTKEYQLLCDMVRLSRGFLFVMAVPGGVSGVKDTLAKQSLARAVRRVRALQEKLNAPCPIVLVCGISTPEQVHASIRDIGADGVMVGSAVSRPLLQGTSLSEVQRAVETLKDATRWK